MPVYLIALCVVFPLAVQARPVGLMTTQTVIVGASVIHAQPAEQPARGESGRTGVAMVAGDRARYALWELLPLGLDEHTTVILSGMLRGELEELVGDRLVVSVRDIDSETRRRVDDCPQRIACMAEASGAFDAQRVVFGVVTNLGDNYNMGLKLLDVQRRKVVARQSSTLSGDRKQLLEQIRILLYKLVAPNRLLGELVLEMDLPGADVYIDGEHIGKTPLPKPTLVGEGEHSLKVASPVTEDFLTFFTAYHGKPTRVVVNVKRIPVVEAELTRPLEQRVGPIEMAPKVGYVHNLGKVGSPVFVLEVACGVPVLVEHLALSIEGSFAWKEWKKRAAGADEKVTTSLWSMPVVARLSYTVPIDPMLISFGAGGGVALVNRAIASESSGRLVTRELEPAVSGALELGWGVGSGRLFIEVVYTHTLSANNEVTGNAGGLRVAAGYRFEL
jgi:hypothetical protein